MREKLSYIILQCLCLHHLQQPASCQSVPGYGFRSRQDNLPEVGLADFNLQSGQPNYQDHHIPEVGKNDLGQVWSADKYPAGWQDASENKSPGAPQSWQEPPVLSGAPQSWEEPPVLSGVPPSWQDQPIVGGPPQPWQRAHFQNFQHQQVRQLNWQTVQHSDRGPQSLPNYQWQDPNIKANNPESWHNNGAWQKQRFQVGGPPSWQNGAQWQDPPIQSAVPPNRLPYSPCNPSPVQQVPPSGCAECQWRYQQRLPCVQQYNPCTQYLNCPPVVNVRPTAIPPVPTTKTSTKRPTRPTAPTTPIAPTAPTAATRPTVPPTTVKEPPSTATTQKTSSTTTTSITTTTTTTTATSIPTCKGNQTFSIANTEYYLSLPYSGLSWHESDSKSTALAKQLGTNGHRWKLAELNTRRQMDQLKQMIIKEGCSMSEVWIGGNDIAEDDSWVWTGGDPVTGDLWGLGEDNGDCMVLLDYYWYQTDCDGSQQVERAFLAQKESLPAPRTTTLSTTSRPITTTITTTKSTVRPTARPETTSGGEPAPTQA